jgi:hypothetical protein
LDLLNTVIGLIDEMPKELQNVNLTVCSTGSGAIELSQKKQI